MKLISLLERVGMTELLEIAIAKLKTLPADEQDAIAARLLAEMEAVAKEKGYTLELPLDSDPKNKLLNQLASTEAVVWSPDADRAAVQALSDLLVAAQGTTNA